MGNFAGQVATSGNIGSVNLGSVAGSAIGAGYGGAVMGAAGEVGSIGAEIGAATIPAISEFGGSQIGGAMGGPQSPNSMPKKCGCN